MRESAIDDVREQIQRHRLPICRALMLTTRVAAVLPKEFGQGVSELARNRAGPRDPASVNDRHGVHESLP
ncbi:hypothetical protein ACM42_16720 [Bradyrhizobium sp. CCBAU 25338]|nr:hypothetical protein [Bradyrhizobium sp. CCBAU 25338]